jgi:hypothetical protein
LSSRRDLLLPSPLLLSFVVAVAFALSLLLPLLLTFVVAVALAVAFAFWD